MCIWDNAGYPEGQPLVQLLNCLDDAQRTNTENLVKLLIYLELNYVN